MLPRIYLKLNAKCELIRQRGKEIHIMKKGQEDQEYEVRENTGDAGKFRRSGKR